MFAVQWVIDRRAEVAVRAHEAMGVALEEVTEACLHTANQTCPIETGTLIASGQAVVDTLTLEAAVTYDTPYAIIQHEDTTFHHDPGRRARWLALTIEENKHLYEAHFAAVAAAYLEGP